MKLRLKGNQGNSLRLRVSRSELERLLRGEAIVEEVRFAPGPEGVFCYRLTSAANADRVTLTYAKSVATVAVPAARVKLWGAESEVGIYDLVELGEGAKLELVLEKDFACLDRADADNADTFEHPQAGSIC